MLGLEAAADAGGLTSFSKRKTGGEKTKQRGIPIRHKALGVIQVSWERKMAQDLCVLLQF